MDHFATLTHHKQFIETVLAECAGYQSCVWWP